MTKKKPITIKELHALLVEAGDALMWAMQGIKDHQSARRRWFDRNIELKRNLEDRRRDYQAANMALSDRQLEMSLARQYRRQAKAKAKAKEKRASKKS